MASKNVNKDHTLQVQWDGSKVEKGWKNLERRMHRLGQRGEKRDALRQKRKERSETTSADRIAKAQISASRKVSREQERVAAKEEILRRRTLNQIDSINAAVRRSRASGVSAAHSNMQALGGKKAGLEAGLSQLGQGLSLKALSDLDKKMWATARAAKNVKAELAAVTREMHKQNFLAKGLGESVRNLGRSYISVFAAIAGGVALYRVGEQLEQVQSSLIAVSGSTEQVAKDWEFIQSRALGLGQDLVIMAKGYQQISIAGKTMGLSLEEFNHVFMASAEAATAFNLSVDDSQGIMRAFTQIMSRQPCSA